jgi:hypothetical protein
MPGPAGEVTVLQNAADAKYFIFFLDSNAGKMVNYVMLKEETTVSHLPTGRWHGMTV